MVSQGKQERGKPFANRTWKMHDSYCQCPSTLSSLVTEPTWEVQELVDMLNEDFRELVCWHREPEGTTWAMKKASEGRQWCRLLAALKSNQCRKET